MWNKVLTPATFFIFLSTSAWARIIAPDFRDMRVISVMVVVMMFMVVVTMGAVNVRRDFLIGGFLLACHSYILPQNQEKTTPPLAKALFG